MTGERARESHYQRRERWRTRAGEWLLFALAWSLRILTWPVPSWTLSGALAPLGGWLALAVPGFRRRAEANLRLVWPDRPATERRRIIRDAGREFVRLMVEYARLDKFVRGLDLDIAGVEHLRGAAATGRGVVLVSAHYGNWEAVRLAAGRLGVECGIIYRPFNNRYLDRFTVNLIPCAGRPVLHKGRKGMRRMRAHVGQGGVVLILVDQRNSGAPMLPFLGHPAETVTAAADLARRTGAALLPARAARDAPARRFHVRFEAPIAADGAEAMMAEVNARISQWITERPEQWFWFHRRWRRTLRSRSGPG